MNYTWVFLETGRVKKVLKFCLCAKNGKGYVLKDTITDLNVAYQYEKGAIDSGHEFTNHIDDFLAGEKHGSMKGLRRMGQTEFNAFLKGDA